MPERFVLKANHGSSWNVVIKDRDSADWKCIRKKFMEWMTLNFAFMVGFEMQYYKISPKIIAEEFIENQDGNLFDYKIHCFDGKPKYIQIIGNRDLEKHTGMEAFYDTNWKLQKFTYTYPRYETERNKPKKLKEMLCLAKKLSADFAYVRVDFYELDDGELKFGEMTFTPASGVDQWKPEEMDLVLGEEISLPNKKEIWW